LIQAEVVLIMGNNKS